MRIGKIFNVIITLSIIFLIILFSHEFLYDTYSKKDIIQIILSVFTPVPITIYLAFLFAKKEQHETKKEIEKDKFRPVLIFLMSIICCIFLIYFFEKTYQKHFEKTVYPFIINSTIISLYILNYSQLKNIYFAGILSGVSIGTVLYVVFFT